MSTQVEVNLALKYNVSDAIRLLHTKVASPTEYEYILKEILKTGHDINANNSELLLYALYQSTTTGIHTDNIVLLFSLGAQVASSAGVYDGASHSHAFNAGRVYKADIAKALFDHVMASPHFDVISHHISNNQPRIGVFGNLESDDDQAALYVRIGVLPEHCSPKVLAICAKSGLCRPPRAQSVSEQIKELTQQCMQLTAENTRLQEQLTAETAQTASLKEQLTAETAQIASLKEQLTAETDKLTKASGIIAKLTSL